MPLENGRRPYSSLPRLIPHGHSLFLTRLATGAPSSRRSSKSNSGRPTSSTNSWRPSASNIAKPQMRALGPMTFAEKAEMAEELVNYVGEFGISREQLLQEAQTNLAIHHPAFQKMAADAVKYRRMQNAPKAVASKNLPPVQRPGVAQPQVSTDLMGWLDALERRARDAVGVVPAASAPVRQPAKLQPTPVIKTVWVQTAVPTCPEDPGAAEPAFYFVSDGVLNLCDEQGYPVKSVALDQKTTRAALPDGSGWRHCARSRAGISTAAFTINRWASSSVNPDGEGRWHGRLRF